MFCSFNLGGVFFLHLIHTDKKYKHPSLGILYCIYSRQQNFITIDCLLNPSLENTIIFGNITISISSYLAYYAQ